MLKITFVTCSEVKLQLKNLVQIEAEHVNP
jgi:hypothetical protein